MTSDGGWSHLPERGSRWIMRGFLFVINAVGYRIASLTLPAIVLYFVASGRGSRRASREYLSKLHRFRNSAPAPSLVNVYLHHLEFARTLLERVFLWQGKIAKFRFATEGRELFEQPDERPENKRGAVVIGAHLGSFDVLRVLGSELTTPVHYVMHRAHAQHINTILKELNPDSNLRVVELSPGEIDGILKLKDCVERGDHIAILGDRHPPGQEVRGCKVSFLGHEASFPQNAWILAHLLKCKIILALSVRTGPRAYRIIAKSLTPDGPWICDRHAFVRSHLTSFVKELEEVCCSYPFQWFNYYDFWCDPEDSTTASHRV